MAVERKTFLWIGNDRAVRRTQIMAGNMSGASAGFGATGIASYTGLFGQHYKVDFSGQPGTTAHLQAMDVFWNNPNNWAEKTSGLSGGDGITQGGQFDGDYYIRASRIPHRGDHVIFEYVKGTTGNGLLRGYVGDAKINPLFDPIGITGDAYGKPFDAPLSPCLFGGMAHALQSTDGLSAAGPIWVLSDGVTSTGGTASSNQRGPLSSVKVLPSYFHHAHGVMGNSDFAGYFNNIEIDSQSRTRFTYPYWGGEVIDGPSGASFGDVDWSVGRTGINLKALDVQLNTPFRMNNKPFFIPPVITNEAKYGGLNIDTRGDVTSPDHVCRLGFSENIINLSVGCRYFIQRGGTVANLTVGDMYMPFASDASKRAVATYINSSSNFAAPEEFSETTGVLNGFVYNGTITNVLRCDPCWYSGLTDFVGTCGNPEIIWGPYYAFGEFEPRVTTSPKVTTRPQKLTGRNFSTERLPGQERGVTTDAFDNQVDSDPITGKFGSFQILGVDRQRFAVTTIDMKEFNPRWDVTTSEGNSEILPVGARGFNNKCFVGAGCTITNLNIDAGYFSIGNEHAGGDTFDEPSEVGDVVILNGYAERKAYLRGEHPIVPSFNAFYIGKGGVSETGAVFQMRSKEAEFDFGPGVFVRSGPDATGVTGAGVKFVAAIPVSFKR